MTSPTVARKPHITIPEGAFVSLSGKSPRGAGIIAPTGKHLEASDSLMLRFTEIYKRALADEQRLTQEVERLVTSARIEGLEQELTRLIDDSMCLKRIRTFLHLDSITLDPVQFTVFEKHTSALQQKIRCMGIIMRLHYLRDERDPSTYQRNLLACLFKAYAHIPCLKCIKQPKVIDPSNKPVYEKLFYIIKEQFIGLHMGGKNLETHVNFIKEENLPYMNIDVLQKNLRALIGVVKNPRFITSVADKLAFEPS